MLLRFFHLFWNRPRRLTTKRKRKRLVVRDPVSQDLMFSALWCVCGSCAFVLQPRLEKPLALIKGLI